MYKCILSKQALRPLNTILHNIEGKASFFMISRSFSRMEINKNFYIKNIPKEFPTHELNFSINKRVSAKEDLSKILLNFR